MAQTKKKKASPSKAKKPDVKNKKQSRVKDDVYGVLLLLAAVLVIFSLTTDLIGVVGGFLRKVFFGLLGPGAFLLPVFFVYIGIMLIATNKKLTSRGVFGSVFILVFSSFFNIFLFTAPQMNETPFPEYLSSLTSSLFETGSTSLSSGGVLGGYISVPLSAAFGKVGAGIILFAIMLVTFIVATGIDIKAMFAVMKSDGHRNEEEPTTEERIEKHRLKKEEKEKAKEAKAAAKKERAEIPELDEKAAKERRDRFTFVGAAKEAESGKKLEEYFDDIAAQYSNGNKTAEIPVEEPVLEEKKPEREKFDPEIAKEVAEDIDKNLETPTEGEYVFPPVDLLNYIPQNETLSGLEELKQNAEKLIDTLRSFNIEARVINVSRGPSVTRYELQPSTGVRVSKITNLADDIALQLAATAVRIEAPIPGKSAIGIEVPNKDTSTVQLREIIDSDEFRDSKSKLSVALGKNISGENIVIDLAKMPHLMIAGATGSGKSVCVNSMLMSILFHARPDEVKLILVDPKVVELNVYNGLPHLLIPVVTEAKKAAGALGWAVGEMLKRYNLFTEKGVRDFKGYNESLSEEEQDKKLPQIVIVIDEMADLMMTAPHEVEDAVCRLAQMARAAGMHLVIATQRPSADVITGTIKANVPSRIAFSVSSAINSRIILDESGAEKLVGKGDMLYMPIGSQKALRVQGCFVSDKEVEKVIAFIKEHSEGTTYDESVVKQIDENAANLDTNKLKRSAMQDEALEESGDEAVIRRAIEVVVNEGRASTSVLQRRLSLGYARAARIMDELYERGVIGPYQGSKPREVLMTKDQYLEMINRGE